MARLALAGAVLVAGFCAACGGDDEARPTMTPAPASAAQSLAFIGGDVTDGEPIDARFTCDGENVSPALSWEEPPLGTVEQALVVDDPDAPGDGFVHWIVFGIPPDRTGLETGETAALGQGANDAGGVGWTGPCPPGGETHGYVFTLSALDAETGLEEGASLGDLRAAVDGHVLAQATLTAPYARSPR